MFKKYLLAAKIGAAAICLLLIIAAAWYVDHLRRELHTAQESVRNLTTAVEIQQKTIKAMQTDIAAINEAGRAVNTVVSRAQQEITDLRIRFNTTTGGTARDIGRLAIKKPQLIENAVNRGSLQATRCMEIASGAALTSAELSATKPSEINSLCPGLANPNYVAR